MKKDHTHPAGEDKWMKEDTTRTRLSNHIPLHCRLKLCVSWKMNTTRQVTRISHSGLRSTARSASLTAIHRLNATLFSHRNGQDYKHNGAETRRTKYPGLIEIFLTSWTKTLTDWPRKSNTNVTRLRVKQEERHVTTTLQCSMYNDYVQKWRLRKILRKVQGARPGPKKTAPPAAPARLPSTSGFAARAAHTAPCRELKISSLFETPKAAHAHTPCRVNASNA